MFVVCSRAFVICDDVNPQCRANRFILYILYMNGLFSARMRSSCVVAGVYAFIKNISVYV